MTALRTEDATREKTARRLLASSAKNSYDPELDIDWSAPVDDRLAYLPYERVSLYGTALWDEMAPDQRRELAKQELASVASTGLWFEIILIQMLARYAYDQDPQAAHTQYALTEIGDETRHVIMFSKWLSAIGAPTYRPRKLVHHLGRLYKATARGSVLFAPVLVAEEITDRIQRETMNDEAVQPLVRMVNRIHVVEESRHVRFAREEVARRAPAYGRLARTVNSTLTAIVSAVIIDALINPQVYETVGLDPKRAAREARRNPHHRETRRWMAEKIIGFLQEQGMVTATARPFYKLVHVL